MLSDILDVAQWVVIALIVHPGFKWCMNLGYAARYSIWLDSQSPNDRERYLKTYWPRRWVWDMKPPA